MGHVAHWGRETLLNMDVMEFEEEFNACLKLHNHLNTATEES